MLSAMPLAILPRVEAVQGAMSMASAHSPRSTCEFHVPSLCAKNSLITGLWVSADSVIGVINSFPAGVITTCTSAPAFTSPRIIRHALYAAMLPVIPSTIFFPFNIFLYFFFISIPSFLDCVQLPSLLGGAGVAFYFCASLSLILVSTCLVLYVKSPPSIQL